jgi:putative flippase GtrA
MLAPTFSALPNRPERQVEDPVRMVLNKPSEQSEANVPFQHLLCRRVIATLAYSNGGYYQFSRFLLVGCLNTAFGQAVFIILVLCGLQDVIALLLATVAGVLFNYLTAKRVVFQKSGTARWKKFILCYAFTFGLNALLLRLGTEFISPIPAQLLLAFPIALLTFTLMRRYVFVENGGAA